MPVISTRDSARGPHILVVDDDKTSLERSRQRLREAGYRVTATTMVAEVTTYLALLQPDVLLLDVLMPGLSGETVALLLRQQSLLGATRVILHSPVSPNLLRNLVDTSGALGVLAATDDDDAFLRAFRLLLESAGIDARDERERNDLLTSGTHRIGAPRKVEAKPLLKQVRRR